MPSSESDKKGFIDSLFSFFKSDEEANQKKPMKKFSTDRNRNKGRKPNKFRKPRPTKFKNDRKVERKSKPISKKPIDGNKKPVKVEKKPILDDNIGNVKEVKQAKKRPVVRAKNDPRSGNR